MKKPLLTMLAVLLCPRLTLGANVNARAVAVAPVFGAFRPALLTLTNAPSFTLSGGALAAPTLTPQPLSSFLKQIDPKRPIVALIPGTPGLEVHGSLVYDRPVPGSKHLRPVYEELRPSDNLRKDMKRLKKALATLPEQLESVWPRWRESVITDVGITHERGVYVNLISRDAVLLNFYATARLEKRGKRWVLVKDDARPSAINLQTRPTVESAPYMVPARHDLRAGDVKQDLAGLPGFINRLLSSLPKRYASYIIEAVSLGLRGVPEADGLRPWLKARLSSNKPLSGNTFETATLIKP